MGIMSELLIQLQEEMIEGAPFCKCPFHQCVTVTNADVCAWCYMMCSPTAEDPARSIGELEGMEYDDKVRDAYDMLSEIDHYNSEEVGYIKYN